MPHSNPFLDRRFDIRWSLLTPELIQPAIDEALADATEALNSISSQDRSALTFASTIEALESATDALNEAWGKVGHLVSVNDSPALRAAYNAILPKVTEFFAKIHLDGALWKTIEAYSGTPEASGLSGIRKRLLDETLADFRQAGAGLGDAKKKRLEQLESELAAITQKYSENVLDATNAWELIVEDEGRLAGLPKHAKEAARRNALSKGHGTDESPKWRFTLHHPSQEPVMNHASDESLRKEVWEAAIGVGARAPHDNHELIRSILKLRREKAQILGKRDFPDLVLERRMARNGTTAIQFVDDLHRKIRASFARECQELQEFKASKTGGASAPLAPWEVAYWAEKMRKEKYDFDDEEVRPFFPMNRVLDGLFTICEKVFGVVVVRRATGAVEGWHPEVEYFDLNDSGGRKLGSFYTDWHPRESKRGGAWMNYLITGTPNRNGRTPHLGLMCGNMTPPVGDKPALLSHREVETVFHEFGHLIHHLLGDVEYKSLNGVNVAWDFVELPSQIMENWTWERDGLNLFARHFESGVTIPDVLVEKLNAARNFRSASATMRQLALGKMDLEMHMHSERFLEGDLDAAIETLLRDFVVSTNPAAPSIACRFGHLFSSPVGYAAGYYSYKWAEVLDADAFTRFKENGIFDPDTGRAFRAHVLSRGNSEQPEVLFRRFMGRDPDPDALLARCGLAES